MYLLLCLDSERSDKSNTILEGNELMSGSTLVSGRPSCGPSGPALGPKPDPRVDTRPRSPLLVGIVYVPTEALIIDLSN